MKITSNEAAKTPKTAQSAKIDKNSPPEDNLKENEVMEKKEKNTSNKKKDLDYSQYFHCLQVALVLEKTQCNKKHLAKILQLTEEKLDAVVQHYNAHSYKTSSPFFIKTMEKDYLWTIRSDYNHPLVSYYRKKKRQFSQPSLETLAIIAYKQPISKAQIDYTRGINSAGPIKVLQEENLIQGEQEKNSPYHPLLYRTTQKFLEFFSLNSLKELPDLEEINNYPFLEEKLP